MAVRREVVSFSQLLRERNQAPREPSLSQSQVSTLNSSSGSQCSSTNHSGSHAHGGGLHSSQRDVRHLRDDLHGLQPRVTSSRALCDHGTAFGSQGATHSQAESTATRMWSQSQDETGWTGCMTSQSQSQTQKCVSQPPLPRATPSIAPTTFDERSLQVPQRPFLQHSKFSKMLLESGKLSLETSRERARSEEEVVNRLVMPVNDALKEIKTILEQQTQAQTQQAAVQAEMGSEIRSMKDVINQLNGQVTRDRKNCDGCHDKMGKEAAAARAAFESMSQRMSAMERNVDVFLTNMTTFVREELFSMQIQRESGRMSSSFSSGARPAVKRRLVEQTPLLSRRYAPLPCSTTPKKRANSHRGDSVESRKPTSTERRRSQRLQSRRQREEEEEVREENYAQDTPAAEDPFGIKLALARVEEARAKRRRQL